MVEQPLLILFSLRHDRHHFLMIFPWKSIYISRIRRKWFYIVLRVGQVTSEDAKKVMILQKWYLTQEYIKFCLNFTGRGSLAPEEYSFPLLELFQNVCIIKYSFCETEIQQETGREASPKAQWLAQSSQILEALIPEARSSSVRELLKMSHIREKCVLYTIKCTSEDFVSYFNMSLQYSTLT